MKAIFEIIRRCVRLGVLKENKFLQSSSCNRQFIWLCQYSKMENSFIWRLKKCNDQVFLDLLRHTLSMYEEKHVVLTLDNARIHHAELLTPFLEKHEDRLTLLFLPPYLPNLNVVERTWGWLKGSVIAN